VVSVVSSGTPKIGDLDDDVEDILLLDIEAGAVGTPDAVVELLLNRQTNRTP
jgi:hypothetical protein